MTGVDPISVAGLGLSVLSTIGDGMSRGAEAEARRETQARQAENERNRRAHEQQQHALRQRVEERRIERERKQALATQRARLAASGVSGTGGSADAIMAGIHQRADQRLTDLRADTLFQPEPVDLLADDTGDTLKNIAGFGHQVLGVADQTVDLLSNAFPGSE
ncbi:hypothetical protein KAJ83_04550 [Marivibrio halodurans]|uniref:Uncharacterized protein n=1 Tax=Marivibrio halodurans TaxID=2039722 RepID=A0A8J7SLI9_9PROT|nr:hypothetical protein [Marivibrio halodurans]MBP5856266.1 hypothetical protein [Marivibrio halodurans]